MFPAAVGSKLNVSSFPFPLSCEVGQTLWDASLQIPSLNTGSFPKPLTLDANFVLGNSIVQKWGCFR